MHVIDVGGFFNVRTSSPHAPRLVRSGAMENLAQDGLIALKALGVVAVLGLREPSEVGHAVHDIPVHAVQLYDREPPATDRLEEIYEAALRERGHALTRAVGIMSMECPSPLFTSPMTHQPTTSDRTS